MTGRERKAEFPRGAQDTLTAGEIAERLAPFAPDVAATRARIKVWAREGLLAALSEKYPGMGKHRQFGLDTVIDAAVLTVLADVGLRISGRDLLYALGIARGIYSSLEARNGSGDIEFLEIPLERGKSAKRVAYPHTGSVKPLRSAAASIVVNINQIYSRLGKLS